MSVASPSVILKGHWCSECIRRSFTTTGALQPTILYTPKFAHESYAQLNQSEIRLKSFEKVLDSYYSTILSVFIVYSLVSNADEVQSFSELLEQLTESSRGQMDSMHSIEVQNRVQTEVMRDLSESSILSAEEALADYLKSQDRTTID